MLKKVLVTMLSNIILLNMATTAIAAEGKTIDITEEKLHLYPTFSSFTTKYTSGSMVENIVPLAEDENAITVSLTDVNDKEFYFVSVYDITEEQYITSSKGVPIAKDKFIAKGLVGGHDYKIRASSLFNESIVNGKISTSYIDSEQVTEKPFIAAMDDFDTDEDKAVFYLKSVGVVNGYEDGGFKPENKITRAEAATMISRAIVQKGCSVSGVNALSFSDVKREDWFFADVLRVSDFDIIIGYEDGTFKPGNNITYQEFIKMLVSMLFCDSYAQQEGGYPQGYLTIAKELGITHSITFDATDKITRGDVAIMLKNAINTPLMLTGVFDTSGNNQYEQSTITYSEMLSE